MGIKYFYNFCVSSLDDTRLDGDILSAVRKSYFDEFDKIRDKITLDSESDSLIYDYCIEKDKPLRWTVRTAQGAVLQDVSVSDGGRYYLCFYRDGRLFKRLLFSRLHTLLRAEYTDDSGAVRASVEPRKRNGGLCLLYTDKELGTPVVLTDMPYIGDDAVRARVESEFTDYTVTASTNEGVVRYLTVEQRAALDIFISKVRDELSNIPEENFVNGETPLADKINAKDFNVKRNLSASLDITKARDFSAPARTEEPVVDDIDELVPITADEAYTGEALEAAPAESAPEPDKLIMADGAVYSYYGELDESGDRSGYGRTMTDLGRTAYEGTYLDDKRSGKGSYYYKDGTLCYSGEWAENARHGVGVGVSSRDGSIHLGRWKNNKPEGNGVRMSADGDIRFVCKEMSDGKTVLMNFTDDDTVVISQYDSDGSKIAEKSVSLEDF